MTRMLRVVDRIDDPQPTRWTLYNTKSNGGINFSWCFYGAFLHSLFAFEFSPSIPIKKIKKTNSFLIAGHPSRIS